NQVLSCKSQATHSGSKPEVKYPRLLQSTTDGLRLSHPVSAKPLLTTYNLELPHLAAWPNALISTSTPGGRSSFISASTVSGVGSRMSISRLCVRISNCSRDFLSTCGDRKTVQRLIVVGRGIGPATSAPVRFAVSTISRVDWSRILWSNAFKRIRILSPCLMFFLFVSYSTISV